MPGGRLTHFRAMDEAAWEALVAKLGVKGRGTGALEPDRGEHDFPTMKAGRSIRWMMAS